MRRVASLFFTITVAITAALAFPGEAQVDRSPRGVLIQEIRTRAQQDAQSEKGSAGPQDLAVLFGEEAAAAGLKLSDAVSVYDGAYAAAKPPKRWWVPGPGWVVAGLLFVLLIFRDWLKGTLEQLVKTAGEWAYRRIAGHRLFRRKALRRYRRALVQKYRQLRVPFRPERPLDVSEVYVPLKVKGESATDQVDAVQRIAAKRRLMVVGTPGSGKSMLLRHLALSYARGVRPGLPGEPVPVLLELNRLNEKDGPIEDRLVEIFDLNDFPNAASFVHLGLLKGTLLLLFDGLDEVNSTKRAQVVQQITDLLDRHEECRAVITCRIAVYRNEFAQSTDETLEIVDFSDQEIQRFLSAWQSSMPPGKSIEQLVRTLRERPRIMALARNPLLLTIIAYLYTDLEFVLPHSRSEFYDQAVDVLLRQWKVENNRFPAPSKRLALEHLALFNQDRSAGSDQDRRSIDLKTVLEAIGKLLPSLNIDPGEATSFLNEVVERSGLLLAVDGGARYQFAHLTLQEFFAANALRDNPNGLVDRFQKDRDAWRETVKLWCGLNHDGTTVIRAIRESDPITAFECLADAQKIDPALADEIVGSFKERLGEAGETGDAILRAFAAVAAGPSQRAKAVFNFLTRVLQVEEDSPRAAAAATGLSLTSHPLAVQALSDHYSTMRFAVRPALIGLGDLAVPALKDLAGKGESLAVADLAAIKTPLAALALADLLWLPEPLISRAAAWHLATISPQALVEEALREARLHDAQRNSNWKYRLLEPFGEPPNSVLSIVLGQAAALIEDDARDPASTIEVMGADLRILVPLILESPERSALYQFDRRWMEEALRQAEDSKEEEKPSPREVMGIQSMVIMQQLGRSPIGRFLGALEAGKRFHLLRALLRFPQPSLEHWRVIRQPLVFDKNRSWQCWSAWALTVLISIAALTEAVIRIWAPSAWVTGGKALLLSAALSTALSTVFMNLYLFRKKTRSEFEVVLAYINPLVIVPPVRKALAEEINLKKWREAGKTVALASWIFSFWPFTILLSGLLLSRRLGLVAILAVLATFAALLVTLILDIRRKEIRSRNPLRGLLEVEEPADHGRLQELYREIVSPSSLTR